MKKILANSSNYTKGRTDKIQYIVIHYTANNGDTASGNCKYFQTPNRKTSAHYFIDENEACQSVEDNNTAWHCGTSGTYKHKYCRNNNSLGVELCSRKDSKGEYYFLDRTINNAIALVKELMKKYNVPIENVIRHYDATGKSCPLPMMKNIKLWNNFKEMLVKGDEEVEIIKRSFEYENKKKELDVVNVNGNNFVKVRDLAELLGKEVSYDSKTKVTNLK